MSTYEERAEKYAGKHAPRRLGGSWLTAEQIREVRDVLARAYLAGAERAREDDREACPVTR